MTLKRVEAGVAAAATALLAACAVLPPTTALKLATFDPMTTDPAAIRAAVRLPTTIEIPPGAAHLIVTVGYAGDGETETRRFDLTETDDTEDDPTLAAHAKPGFELHIFRLAPETAAAFAAFRSAAAARASAAPGKNSLTLGVSAEACRTAGEASDPVLLTTFFSPDRQTGFLVLTKEIDVASLVGADGKAASVPPCPPG